MAPGPGTLGFYPRPGSTPGARPAIRGGPLIHDLELPGRTVAPPGRRLTILPSMLRALASPVPPRSLAGAITASSAFRWILVGCQASTIVITWPLWQTRTTPPLLPALDLFQFDAGPVLLGSLGLVMLAPRLGVAVHAVALGLAMLLDQSRMQPEFVSLALLMVGTLDSPTCVLIARAHLVALWFFAGFHKLVSVDYYLGTVPRMFGGWVGHDPPWPLMFDLLRAGMALAEMGLGVLAAVPRTRRVAALGACALHLGIVGYLALRIGANPAVWPWNLALALGGPFLLWNWRSSPRDEAQAAPRWARLAVAGLLLSPMGFYAGYVDAYFAHCLYCRSIPRARIVSADGVSRSIDTYGALRVPFPPTARLFRAYFARTGRPGDRLIVEDARRWLGGRREWTFEEVSSAAR
jgi:hypothetical protein